METPKPPSLAASSDSYAFHLQACLRKRDLFSGKSIHAQIIKSGLHFGVFLMNNLMSLYMKTGYSLDAHRVFEEMPVRNTLSWNAILSAYAKQGKFDAARRVFNEMPERDSVSWTSMIVGYNQMGRFGNAIQMFVDMISDGVTVTQFTITNILSACAAVKALDVGRKVHSFVVKLAVGSYVSVANCLLNMYAKSGDPRTAKIVLIG
ncbi:unnamed protein product [Prunus armeniaca]|uniref:Pentatricopeptide repeat-containing protein n=1 Tax=Prunus armeniaca TaxID=36596 RepID=A0A6J5WVD5_PRUAR|nr:unnamed protein product [Prunus armeniaca]